MKPDEFWNCTYREVVLFVNSNSLQREKDLKQNIVLLDALGNKLIGAFAGKRPKNVSLIKDTFSELFKEELDSQNHEQTLDEQIRNLRSRK